MLAPLTLSPRLVEVVWGGSRLASLLARDLPIDRPIGETWEVYDEDHIETGPYAGQTLAELARAEPLALLGTRAAAICQPGQAFPILLKFIDAAGALSLQVHPDDTYACEYESGSAGKAEAYYVLAAEPGARLYYGLDDRLDRAGLAAALADGTIEQHLRWIEPRPGEVIYSPPGTIHALGAGLVVFEVQQCSTITYRVYDWGRLGADGRPRQLHVSAALAVACFPQPTARSIVPLAVTNESGERLILAADRHFVLEALDRPGAAAMDGTTFHLLTSLGGVSRLEGTTFGERVIEGGQTLVLPASAGGYRYAPPEAGRLLRCYVPDLVADVVEPLRSAGHADAEIAQLGEVFVGTPAG